MRYAEIFAVVNRLTPVSYVKLLLGEQNSGYLHVPSGRYLLCCAT